MSVSMVKANGTYLFTCKYLDPISKTYHRATRRGFKTKPDAILAEAKFIKEKESAPSRTITFEEVFYKYMESRIGEVKPTTYTNWMQRFEKHVIPSLGDRDITKLTLQDLENWRQEMLAKKLSASYMNDILKPVRCTLRYANDFYDLHINFIDKIKRFKDALKFREEIQIWTIEQYRTFDSVIVDSLMWKTFFNLLYFTGLRKGESQALTWEDISFENKTLRVNKTLAEKVKDVQYIIMPPKTRSSYRTIALSNETLELLKQWKREQGGNSNDFVFGIKGKHLTTTTIRRYFKNYTDKAKVPWIRIHSFRHSHASYLISKGMNVVDVSKRLGHSDITMTLNTYTHFIPAQEDRIVSFLNSSEESS